MAEAAALAEEAALNPEERDVRQILRWIGFDTAVVCKKITDESFANFSDIIMLKESDITEMADDLQKRTPAASWVIIGQRRAKKLKAFIHWTKDFRRISLVPTIVGLDVNRFNAALAVAAERQDIRKTQIENSDATLKAASPSPLKSEANEPNGSLPSRITCHVHLEWMVFHFHT